jgi:hypothetical protein
MASLVRCGALLMLLGLVAGCGAGFNISGVTSVPREMSAAQLSASGKGALIVTARFVTTTMTTQCETLKFSRVGDGREILVVMSGYSPFTTEQTAEGVLVEPGTYVATTIYCQRGNTIFAVHAPDARGLARISIGAGEMVDAGTLVVTDDFKPVLTPYIGKSNFIVFVRPRIDPLPEGINRQLAVRLVHRPMTAVDPPPYEVLAKICQDHREHAKTLWFSSGNEKSPLCELIGPRPARKAPPSRRDAGQPI